MSGLNFNISSFKQLKIAREGSLSSDDYSPFNKIFIYLFSQFKFVHIITNVYYCYCTYDYCILLSISRYSETGR